MRWNRLCASAVLAAWPAWSCLGSEAVRPYDLTVTIRCPVREIRVGDEIPIIFTITNHDQHIFEVNDRSGDRGGRMPEYELSATDAKGRPVPDPRQDYPPMIFGGLSSGLVRLASGDSYEKTIPLNLWSRIMRPGMYSVKATYHYRVDDPSRKPTRDRRYMNTVSVPAESIKIVVRGRSDTEMEQYIRSLVQELDSLPQPQLGSRDDRRERLAERLMYTCDKRIVPTMLDLTYKNWENNEVFWATMALVCYVPQDAEIGRAVLQAAQSRGLAPGMQIVLEQLGCGEQDFAEIVRLSLASQDTAVVAEAVGAAQEHPSDEYMPRLIAIMIDPDKAGLGSHSGIARARAFSAVAHNRTDEGVAALKLSLEDPSPRVRRDVANAIRHAYQRHPVYPEQVDEEYTATLARAAEDPNSPVRLPAIMEIARTRTAQGVGVLKALLTDPNADVPEADKDRGIQTMRRLLQSRDAELRQETRESIHHVYHEYPGRPLRPDDFPNEYREDPEMRKKAFLQILSGND
jgi:HEAT repeat protein